MRIATLGAWLRSPILALLIIFVLILGSLLKNSDLSLLLFFFDDCSHLHDSFDVLKILFLRHKQVVINRLKEVKLEVY